MKIGIICALEEELKPFLSHIKNCTTTQKAMRIFYEGSISEVNVVAVFCGVGKTNAAITTQILIDTYKADKIINCGVAGGMDEELDIFDTVVCTEAVYHDVHEIVLTETPPHLPSIYFKADTALVESALKVTSGAVFLGKMVTGDTFIEDDGRDEINMNHKPLTVDMETASIAHVCFSNNIPYAAVRTVSDTAKNPGINTFEINCAKAAEISANVVIKIFTQGLL